MISSCDGHKQLRFKCPVAVIASIADSWRRTSKTGHHLRQEGGMGSLEHKSKCLVVKIMDDILYSFWCVKLKMTLLLSHSFWSIPFHKILPLTLSAIHSRCDVLCLESRDTPHAFESFLSFFFMLVFLLANIFANILERLTIFV